MPYIPQSKRKYFDTLFNPDSDVTHPGSLNYLLTRTVLAYIDRKGGPTRAVIIEVLGALKCCLLEFWRRRARQYAPTKETLVFNSPVKSYTTANNLIGEAVHYQMDRLERMHGGDPIQSYYMEKVAPYEDAKIKENGDVY